MPLIFNESNLKFNLRQSPIPEFTWNTSQRLSELVKAKNLAFDVRSLDPNRFSYPYHFHRNSEEIFVILSGKATLRTNIEFREIKAGDVIYFECGPTGAHQLYNHSKEPCRYLDIRTTNGIDVCEYPDSGKVNITPYQEIYEANKKVDYYKNEENVKDKWPKEIIEAQR